MSKWERFSWKKSKSANLPGRTYRALKFCMWPTILLLLLVFAIFSMNHKPIQGKVNSKQGSLASFYTIWYWHKCKKWRGILSWSLHWKKDWSWNTPIVKDFRQGCLINESFNSFPRRFYHQSEVPKNDKTNQNWPVFFDCTKDRLRHATLNHWLWPGQSPLQVLMSRWSAFNMTWSDSAAGQ